MNLQKIWLWLKESKAGGSSIHLLEIWNGPSSCCQAREEQCGHEDLRDLVDVLLPGLGDKTPHQLFTRHWSTQTPPACHKVHLSCDFCKQLMSFQLILPFVTS